MSEARERLERALTRLEALVSRPKSTAHSEDVELLAARCTSLETAARDAITRIDRLLSEEGA